MQTLPDLPELRRTHTRYDSLRLKSRPTQYYLPTLTSPLHTSSSKSISIPSKSFFTTVLREKTEIIEDNLTPEVQTPLTKSRSIKQPKTMPEFDHYQLLQKRTEAVEENNLREKHIERHLKELRRIAKEQPLESTCQFRERKSNCDIREKIIKTSESLLNLYNIRFNFIEITMTDSLMRILRVRDRFLLARCLEIIVREIARFPYSFFKKIGVRNLTFCQDIELYKELKNPIIKKKLLTGTFPLDLLKTEGDIVDHFYKVIFFHLKAQHTELDAQWSRVVIKKSKTIIHISMNAVVKESTKIKKSFFEEQWRLFKDLILSPNQALKNESGSIRNKAFKLKDCMEVSDPDGISEEWWEKKGLSLIVGSLDYLEKESFVHL